MDGLEMRAESRWIGLAHSPVKDVLVGATDTGLIYTVHNATQLHDLVQAQQPTKSHKRKQAEPSTTTDTNQTPPSPANAAASAAVHVAKRVKTNE